MLPNAKSVRALTGLDPQTLPDDVLCATEPLILKGLVSGWPMVQAALHSEQAAARYLRGFYRGATVDAFYGAPDFEGRFFYNSDVTGFNFHPERHKLDVVLNEIERYRLDEHPPAIYVGSATLDSCLPGFSAENHLGLGARDALASVWIGNRTRIAAHFDVPDNIACVAAGHRRFTLFPPKELENLYVGPLDLTPAGQPISLVDFADPDFERFPRFQHALKNAQVAELEPGDALFIPSMWWHHVEALDGFNVLVNYWWRQSPEFMDSPMTALLAAIMSVRDLPAEQRKNWEHVFGHYVFHADAETAAHIPKSARRILGPMDADTTRMLRAQVLKRLNR